MQRTLLPLVIALGLAVSLLPTTASAETTKEERAAHPRIAKAIDDMEDAVAYLEAAPHDFGGHRQAAVNATRQAMKQLHLALQYRAGVDTKHGK